MDADPQLPTAEDYRRLAERARVEARARYCSYLTAVLEAHGVAGAGGIAEAAVDALTEWRDLDTGQRCGCSCHPRLPASGLHDYGFSCGCTRTAEQRRRSREHALNDTIASWPLTPDPEASEAAEADLAAWVTDHPGVTISAHGGQFPEQWHGVVDGHSFYFRERGGDWHIEIDLEPSGRHVQVIEGRNDDGTTRYRPYELELGHTIATGTTDADGYGTTPAQRAQFILTTIRDHLTRQACTHHRHQLDAIQRVLGAPARWCPTCGSRLPG